MTKQVINLQPAFILHHRNFKESGLILELLTRDYGRLSIVANGVRKPKSKIAGLLRPFVPLVVSCSGKSELKTLTHVEAQSALINLQGLALYCGFYLNELISRLLQKEDPYPEVYLAYQQCLFQLASNAHQEQALRLFEFNLLQYMGYGLALDVDFQTALPVVSEKKYQLVVDSGVTEAKQGRISGKTLLALMKRELNEPQVLSEAKFIMRQLIDTHLQGKPLKSRAIISQIIKQL